MRVRLGSADAGSPLSDAVLQRLEAAVGPDHVLVEGDAVDDAGHDWWPLTLVWDRQGDRPARPAAVVRPGSTEEVAAVLTAASAERTPVTAFGGRSGVCGGSLPVRGGISLDLTRLDEIVDIDSENLMCRTQAGVFGPDYEAALADAGLTGGHFPQSIDLSTVGGWIACRGAGQYSNRYGKIEDIVRGLEVVLADGRVLRTNPVPAAATGPDLMRPFVGSEGTLGIITAAVLKLFPRPRERATAFAGFRDIAQSAELFAIARGRAGLELTSFEILPRTGIDMVLKHGENVRDPLAESYPWYALIEISGHKGGGEANDAMEAILSEALERQVIADAAIAASLAQAGDFWRVRELMSEAQRFEGGSIKHDVSVPLSRIPEFVTRASELVVKLVPGSRPVPFGHFGDGNVHFNVSQAPGMDKQDFLAQWDRITGAVHELVAEMNGSISAEHGIGRMKRDLMAKTKSPVEMDLQHRMKAALDPKGILNPGKVLGR